MNDSVDLYIVGQSGGLHAAGYVDRVTPDVILWLVGTNHSGNGWTMI